MYEKKQIKLKINGVIILFTMHQIVFNLTIGRYGGRRNLRKEKKITVEHKIINDDRFSYIYLYILMTDRTQFIPNFSTETEVSVKKIIYYIFI